MLENNGYYELPDKGAGKRWLEIPSGPSCSGNVLKYDYRVCPDGSSGIKMEGNERENLAPISIGDEVVMSPVDYELPDKGGSFRYLGVPINFRDLFPVEKLEGPEFPLDLLKLNEEDEDYTLPTITFFEKDFEEHELPRIMAIMKKDEEDKNDQCTLRRQP